MLCVLLLIALCSLATNVSSRRFPLDRTTHRNQRPHSPEDGLVPRDLIPYHYDLEITPNFYLDAPPFPFDGTVRISFECLVSTSVLTVNSYGLSITSVAVVVSPDSPTNPPTPIVFRWELDTSADFLHAYVTNPFEVGAKYVATISYTGIVNSYEYGLYWDSYVSSVDGKTKYILATQNEEIGAREMFPCFDEPDLKATFNVTVGHQSSVTALSNMPVIDRITRPNGYVASVYAKSPIMSTYQVCVCIGDLLYVEGNWQGILNYPVRIYSRPDIISQMTFAANVSIVVQKWLETETGIEYNLPKLDHIALPSKGGAMENWGLITYGEPYFAVDNEVSPASQRQLAGSFIAHEVAHQWYGNLVTCEWWNDIWLNEGFATYYDYRPLEPLGWPVTEPSQLDTQFFMDSDQRNTSDPVRKQIDTVWDAPYSFAGSTYPKGGAMVHLLEGILGKSTLRAGLTRYLNAYSYSAATSDKLWQSLTDQAADEGYSVDIKKIMDPWLNQMGFPLVTVTRNDDGTATVRQSHFLHPPSQQINVPSQWNYKWSIPLTVVTASSNPSDWDGRPTHWLDIDAPELVITGLPTSRSDWVLVNPKQRFYYRVNYDDANLAAIVDQLVTDHTVIDHESRCNIIDDSFTLARSTYIMETAAMEATRYLSKEVSYNPWYATLKYITQSNRMLRVYSWFTELRTYMLSRVTPVYNSIGWIYRPTEDPDTQLLRRDIVSAACAYGLLDCILNARADFQMYKENPDINSVNPTNLPVVLCQGVAEGVIEDWMLVFSQYQRRRTSFMREERWAYLYAMACTNDSAILDSLLNYIVRGEQIAPRDQYRATLYLSMNPLGADKIFNYFDNSWSTVPSGISKFTILRYITSSFTDQVGFDKLRALITKNPPQSDAQWSSFNQMTLNVQQNINWFTTNNQSLRDWLIAINGPAPIHQTQPLMLTSHLDYWHAMEAGIPVEHAEGSFKY